MASATRTFARALRTSARPTFSAAPRVAFRQNGRFYSSEPTKSASSSAWIWLVGAAAVGGGGAWFYKNGSSGSATPKVVTPKFDDYQAVYNEIASRLEEKDDYDDGSYGPVLVRLAWHASGTFDKETGTGGSNGATMRFAPEGDHGANAGLKAARDFLEPVKKKFPWITYSDLWILAGVCAIQEMLGPQIPYRPGRSDRDAAACTPDGRLPDAAQGQDHLRNIFYRMGFDDQEIVALSGAHALGRCHTDRSGFDGPWTFSPTVLTNDYYKLLLNEKWQWKKWDGPKQLEDKTTKSLMMLPADYALLQDKKFKSWVEKYAADNDLFFKDFAAVIVRLFELGVPFTEGTENRRWVFKSSQ
ncbi:heme peroxidase [Lasiosphaeria miniovina]|uniref:Peroxidase n=1 Tax=Lasiosphaeria miniovina TaxID=1954250 RepID=A0AA40BGZ3_9PEZI|nr:heme peroxidase [Lasiosphaeria miniovina]KAK0734056.1 heme peroxidase [Lasiosphaeria miniovina]